MEKAIKNTITDIDGNTYQTFKLKINFG